MQVGKGSAMKHYNWGSLRSPHTCGENGKLSIYFLIYIYIYIWYVRIPYIHPALFVRDAIFPLWIMVHVTTVAQEMRLTGQKG